MRLSTIEKKILSTLQELGDAPISKISISSEVDIRTASQVLGWLKDRGLIMRYKQADGRFIYTPIK